jgi:hypothetical protein
MSPWKQLAYEARFWIGSVLIRWTIDVLPGPISGQFLDAVGPLALKLVRDRRGPVY